MYALIISLVISACAMPSNEKIQAKMQELQRAYPTAKITMKVDQSCMKAAKFNNQF